MYSRFFVFDGYFLQLENITSGGEPYTTNIQNLTT